MSHLLDDSGVRRPGPIRGRSRCARRGYHLGHCIFHAGGNTPDRLRHTSPRGTDQGLLDIGLHIYRVLVIARSAHYFCHPGDQVHRLIHSSFQTSLVARLHFRWQAVGRRA